MLIGFEKRLNRDRNPEASFLDIHNFAVTHATFLKIGANVWIVFVHQVRKPQAAIHENHHEYGQRDDAA